MTRRRLTPDDRRQIILAAAGDIVKRYQDLYALTYVSIANECAVQTSAELVRHYYPDLSALRAVVRERVSK